MRGVFLALLASIVFTAACDRYVQLSQPAAAAEPAEACPALTAATSAQVLLPPGSAPFGKGAYRVTDPVALSRLVAFINQRRVVSPPGVETPPYPRTRVMFASGSSVAMRPFMNIDKESYSTYVLLKS